MDDQKKRPSFEQAQNFGMLIWLLIVMSCYLSTQNKPEGLLFTRSAAVVMGSMFYMTVSGILAVAVFAGLKNSAAMKGVVSAVGASWILSFGFCAITL